jgi:hypothetical protein
MCIKKTFSVWLIIILLLMAGCTVQGNGVPTQKATGTTDIVEYAPPPTPAATLAELVKNLSDENPKVRVVSAYELKEYGKEAIVALPALRENLFFARYWEVRESAAEALGRLGPDANEAVPDLVSILENMEEIIHVRRAATHALGEIGNTISILSLVPCLYDDDKGDLSIACAEAIGKISGKEFKEANTGGYTLDNQGRPLIVLEARKWWETEGQYQDWEP